MGIVHRMDPVARFWSKVQKSDDPDGCWTWTGGRDGDGYGCYRVKGEKSYRAHRYAFEQTYGPFPPELQVCHTCDNPPCVRPDHLFIGTNTDNMRDMYSKDRGPLGEKNGTHTHPELYRGQRNGRSKLTEEQVVEIRRLLRQGETCAALARHFGVSKTVVWHIKIGKLWKHVE